MSSDSVRVQSGGHINTVSGYVTFISTSHFHVCDEILMMISDSGLELCTDGCFTELLIGNLIGDVRSHEDRHGDAQL